MKADQFTAQFDDLKHYIAATVSQSEQNIKTELRAEIAGLISGSEQRVKSELRAEIGDLREEMHDGFASISDAIAGVHDTTDDHEKRLTKLEQQAA